MLSDILNKHLLITTGKGGVGKSTITAALGLLLAKKGKKVLLIETDTKERMSQIFQVPPIGYDEVEVYPGLWAQNIDPDSSMEEYVLRFVRFNAIYDRLVRKSFLQHWIKGMPGFRELVVLGKIWDMAQKKERRTGRPKYDIMIVDAPATGHGVAFFKVPQSTMETVKTGPMANYSKLMMEFFQDPKNTMLNVVTLAEELPVQETLELLEIMSGDVHLPMGHVIVNGLHRKPYGDGEEEKAFRDLRDDPAKRASLERIVGSADTVNTLIRCADSQARRAELNAHYLAKLREVPHHLIEVPYIFSKTFDKTTIEFIAAYLERGLTEK